MPTICCSWDRRINNAQRRFKLLSDFSDKAVLDRETGLVWERQPSNQTFAWQAVEERGDRRNNREKEELREILRVTTRGIQFACVKLIVRRLNELAIHFRENKPSIDNLRLQLAIVRRPGTSVENKKEE